VKGINVGPGSHSARQSQLSGCQPDGELSRT
jgi:hypothetical protein